MAREDSVAEGAVAARRYESIHRRLSFLRLCLLVLLLIAYFFSGASAHLADGLHTRFGGVRLLQNLTYLAITLFGGWVLLFPLSLYAGFVIEHRFGQSTETLGGWIADSLKALALDLLLFCGFFGALYLFLAWSPSGWWLPAAGLYAAGVAVLTCLAPLVLLPMFFRFEALPDDDLAGDIRRLLEQEGVGVSGIFRWGLGEKTRAANAAVVGLGASRRILLSDTLLDRYAREEIIAVVAHEVGHHRHHDIPRLLAASSLMAALVFLTAAALLPAAVASAAPAREASDVALFPLLALLLLVPALPCFPLLGAYSRRREFAADAYAVRTLRSAEPLVSALQRLTQQNLIDPDPPRWAERLLHGHPSVARRIERARRAAAGVARRSPS